MLELHIARDNLQAKIWLQEDRAQCHRENLEFFVFFLYARLQKRDVLWNSVCVCPSVRPSVNN